MAKQKKQKTTVAKKKAKKVAKPARAAKAAPKMLEKKAGIQPLGDRVLVKRDDVSVTSPAGIIIPDTASKEKSKRGIVVAIGTGKMSDAGDLIPMTVQPGDVVYFNAGWDNEVKVQGDDAEFFLVHESDILAVINN